VEYGKKVPGGNVSITGGGTMVNKKASPEGEAFDFSGNSVA
jgi:hypothetical protein